MSRLKLPIVNTYKNQDFFSIRLWQRDFNDMLSLIKQHSIDFQIEDKERIYSDADDFSKDAPNEISNVNISGSSKDFDSIKKVGLSFSLSADSVSIRCYYNGDAAKIDSLSASMKVLFDKKQKKFSKAARSLWFPLLAFPVYFPIIFILNTAVFLYVIYGGKATFWEVFGINLCFLPAILFFLGRVEKSIKRTDLWLNKTLIMTHIGLETVIS